MEVDPPPLPATDDPPRNEEQTRGSTLPPEASEASELRYFKISNTSNKINIPVDAVFTALAITAAEQIFADQTESTVITERGASGPFLCGARPDVGLGRRDEGRVDEACVCRGRNACMGLVRGCSTRVPAFTTCGGPIRVGTLNIPP